MLLTIAIIAYIVCAVGAFCVSGAIFEEAYLYIQWWERPVRALVTLTGPLWVAMFILFIIVDNILFLSYKVLDKILDDAKTSGEDTGLR